MPNDNDRIVNRRRFFREGFRELLKPLSRTIAPLERALHEFNKLDQVATPPPPPRQVQLPVYWLRPPGAVEETRFRETCSRCGECVRVCPVHAIQLDGTGMNGEGAPYIDAEMSPCVACDGLYCMQSCPSGALVPTAREDINMGTAVWHEDKCLRRQGQECSSCVDLCPIGTDAIKVSESGGIEVIPLNCIGCGVCQQACPTYPKSISVIPKAAREV